MASFIMTINIYKEKAYDSLMKDERKSFTMKKRKDFRKPDNI